VVLKRVENEFLLVLILFRNNSTIKSRFVVDITVFHWILICGRKV
jgi:hypothetical protein